MQDDRLAAVKSLIELSASLEQVTQRLRQFKWDYNGVSVELSHFHLINILERYLSGELSARDIEDWANLIECREDIQISKAFAEWTGATLHELANPLLHTPLDVRRARELMGSISV